MGTNFYWIKVPLTSLKVVEKNSQHARINVFVKGQMSGTLTVDAKDAESLIESLTVRPGYSDDPEIHIGKRSAAGLYCWDCKTTLCEGGESRVHYGDHFHDSCPECGAKPRKETLEESAVGVELGFNKTGRPSMKGVSGCSSFSFAQRPEEVEKRLAAGVWVEDEYGRKLSPAEFRDALKSCPIKFTDSVGRAFF